MRWRVASTALGVAALAMVAGCGGGSVVRMCTPAGASSPLIQQAALFRVDVYAASVVCDGSSVPGDAPAAVFSSTFPPDQAIELSVPPGPHTIALTAWADASATVLLGAGCVANVDTPPGAQICLDINVESLDLGLSGDDGGGDGAAPDLVDRVDGGNSCPAYAEYCDDFEDGLVHFPGRELSGPGTIETDSERPYHASLSLHATTQPEPADASTDTYNRQRAKRPVSPVAGAGSTFALRAYVWFAYGSGSPAVRLFQLSNDTGSSIALGIQNGNWGVGSSWTAPTSMTPVVQGQWACVQWIVDLGLSGRVQILVDGTSVLDVQQQTADPSNAYDSLLVGIRAEKQGATEVFIDDLVYATQPIPCE